MAGLAILQDTREQSPYRFSGCDVEVLAATLPAGDYSLPGFTDRLAVERKELDDLIACLMGSNRERFERELARLSDYELAAVVVEATLDDVRQGRYRSQMSGHAAAQSLFAFAVRFRVPFNFAGDRAGGEYTVYSLLTKYAREIAERCRQLAQKEGATQVG